MATSANGHGVPVRRALSARNAMSLVIPQPAIVAPRPNSTTRANASSRGAASRHVRAE